MDRNQRRNRIVLFATLTCLLLLSLASPHTPAVAAPKAGAVVALPASGTADRCKDGTITATDDGSSAAVPLPFTVDFFGRTFNQIYVNNNGNVTFDTSLSAYTPFGLTSTNHIIIAPYFADVDTQGTGSGVTHYSPTAANYQGRPAFCADWIDVGYYDNHVDKLNSFQLILVDRSDVGTNDFDIIMNYDKVQWESGDLSGGTGGLGGTSARVGYSNGANSAFELPGSAVPGSFLDSNNSTALVRGSRGSLQQGRYVYEVRNGALPTGGTVTGGVYVNSGSTGVGNAIVEACPITGNNPCQTSVTSDSGAYQISGLLAGNYRITAFPPGNYSVLTGFIGPVAVSDGRILSGQNINLAQITPLPPGVTVAGNTPGTLPHLYWHAATAFTATGCAGATATWEMFLNGVVISSGNMTETSPGLYSGSIPPLWPNHGYSRLVITIRCPGGGTPNVIPVTIYIDPSGYVRDTAGNAIAGATVTLYRADNSGGPFTQVPDGSGIMSVANRQNPDTTDSTGHFGWDVVAGYYQVRAEKTGCHAPGNAGQAYVLSAVLQIPPPVTDLDLRLDCGSSGPTVTPTTIGDCGNFGDVHQNDYFYVGVKYLACHGAISGYTDGTFRPFVNTTRGQLAKIIVSAQGWAIDTSNGPHFSDVPAANPFYTFIETAYHHSIISGYTDGSFRWGTNVTRGQLAKIVVSARGWAADTSGGPHFNDVATNNPFYSAIETAYHHAIISGYTDNSFRWGANATRGQIAKIVYAAVQPAAGKPGSDKATPAKPKQNGKP